MFIKKHPWLLFSVLSASLFVLVPGHLDSRGTTPAATLQADGTEPPPLPIPWKSHSSAQSRVVAEALQPALVADGTEPPPLPIPWSRAGNPNVYVQTDATAVRPYAVLTADGTEPPPLPIPWLGLSTAIQV